MSPYTTELLAHDHTEMLRREAERAALARSCRAGRPSRGILATLVAHLPRRNPLGRAVASTIRSAAS